MRILLDHGAPAPLRRHLPEHRVDRSAENGWEMPENGGLTLRAEEDGCEVMVTTYESIRASRIFPGGDRPSSLSWPRHGLGFRARWWGLEQSSRKHGEEN